MVCDLLKQVPIGGTPINPRRNL